MKRKFKKNKEQKEQRTKRTMEQNGKKLYIVASTFDEGFDRADGLLWANSREDVAKYILHLVHNYIKQGKEGDYGKMNSAGAFYRALLSIEPRKLLSRKEWDSLSWLTDENKRETMIDNRLLNLTPQQFLHFVDDSSVDGDSYAKFSISEYSPEEILTI